MGSRGDGVVHKILNSVTNVFTCGRAGLYSGSKHPKALCFGREDSKSLPVAACQDIAQISDSKSLSQSEASSIHMKYSIHQIASLSCTKITRLNAITRHWFLAILNKKYSLSGTVKAKADGGLAKLSDSSQSVWSGRRSD